MAFRPPNYTQTPNELLDDLLPEIKTIAECKVTFVVARYTLGWQRDETELTFSELERLTGLSRTAVSDGIKAAESRGSIVRRREGPAGHERVFYELNISGSNFLPQENPLRCEVPTASGAEFLPLPDTRTQETAGKKKERNTPQPPEGELGKWNQVIEDLCSIVPATTHHNYIEPLTLVDAQPDRLVIAGPDHVATWVRDRWLDAIGEAAFAVGLVRAGATVEVAETEGESRRREQRHVDDQLQARRAQRRRRRAS